MNDESTKNENVENNSITKEDEKENTSTEHITLESLANDMAIIKNDFNKKLQEKEEEITALKEDRSKLEQMLNEQNNLIGNFRETLFNNAKVSPEIAIKPDENHLKQCYEDAYRAAYRSMKHRLIGKNSDEKLFVSRCMEVDNGRL